MEQMKQSKTIKAIVLGTLVAGTLDISEALIYAIARGHSASGVLQFIASGVAGEKAFTGPAGFVMLGMLIHYFITLSWITFFVLTARRYRGLLARPLITGVVFGCVIYVVMNFIVLPISGFGRHPHFTWIGTSNAVLALVCCIGIPLAYLSRSVLHAAPKMPGVAQSSADTADERAIT
jgi:hypothetical protein